MTKPTKGAKAAATERVAAEHDDDAADTDLLAKPEALARAMGGSGSLLPAMPGAQRPQLSPFDREIWKKHRAGDKAARNILVEKYYQLVDLNADAVMEIIARAIAESDFKQAAVVGYLEALDAYQENEVLPFEEYCSLRIRSALVEELKNSIEGG